MCGSADYVVIEYLKPASFDLDLVRSSLVKDKQGSKTDSDVILKRLTKSQQSYLVVLSSPRPGADSKEVFLRYYRQLSTAENSLDVGVSVQQHSRGRFAKRRQESPADALRLERARVLFNLAAYFSQVAAAQDNEPLTEAAAVVKLFQESAGVFVQLRKLTPTEGKVPSELTAEHLNKAETLMMAQAQECVALKIFREQRVSVGAAAKVAREAACLYTSVLELFPRAPLAKLRNHSRKDTIRSKVAFFEALSQYHAAIDGHERQEFGVEVGRLQEARRLLDYVLRKSKFRKEFVTGVVNDLVQKVTTRLASAEADNNLVHLQRIPPVADLPVVCCRQIVRPSACTYLEAEGSSS